MIAQLSLYYQVKTRFIRCLQSQFTLGDVNNFRVTIMNASLRHPFHLLYSVLASSIVNTLMLIVLALWPIGGGSADNLVHLEVQVIWWEVSEDDRRLSQIELQDMDVVVDELSPDDAAPSPSGGGQPTPAADMEEHTLDVAEAELQHVEEADAWTPKLRNNWTCPRFFFVSRAKAGLACPWPRVIPLRSFRSEITALIDAQRAHLL